jgi:hypothetical protein
MSKQNKVNPGQYYVAGRLTPDEAARERVKQRNVASPPVAREKNAAQAPSRVQAKPPRTRAAGRSRG